MSIIKRALNRAVNWQIETFFPDRIFWGRDADPFETFRRVVAKDARGRSAHVIAAHVIIGDLIERDADGVTMTFSGVTSKGETSGKWLINVQKLDMGDGYDVI